MPKPITPCRGAPSFDEPKISSPWKSAHKYHTKSKTQSLIGCLELKWQKKSSAEIILSSLPLIISKWQKPIFCHNLSPPPYIPVQFTESSSSHHHTPHLSPHPNSPLHYLGRGFWLKPTSNLKVPMALQAAALLPSAFSIPKEVHCLMSDLWNCFQIDMLIASPMGGWCSLYFVQSCLYEIWQYCIRIWVKKRFNHHRSGGRKDPFQLKE